MDRSCRVASWMDWLLGRAGAPHRGRLRLHRRWHIAGAVVAWIRAPERSEQELAALRELLAHVDVDPFPSTLPVLRRGSPPGTRWAPCGELRVYLVFDPTENTVAVVRVAGGARGPMENER